MHGEETLDEACAAELEGDPGCWSTGVMWSETQNVPGCSFTRVGVLLVKCGFVGVFLLRGMLYRA